MEKKKTNFILYCTYVDIIAPFRSNTTLVLYKFILFSGHGLVSLYKILSSVQLRFIVKLITTYFRLRLAAQDMSRTNCIYSVAVTSHGAIKSSGFGISVAVNLSFNVPSGNTKISTSIASCESII